MALTIATAASIDPVTAAEAKTNQRIDISDHDTLLENLISAATGYVEDVSGRALITQTWDMKLDAFPGVAWIKLPKPPLQSVTHVKYTDSDDDESTFSSASYYVDTDGEPGRIMLKSNYTWPADTLRIANGVVVRFVCGYGDATTDVPEKWRQAILMLVAHWYENPEASYSQRASGNVSELPLGVRSLLGLDLKPYGGWENA